MASIRDLLEAETAARKDADYSMIFLPNVPLSNEEKWIRLSQLGDVASGLTRDAVLTVENGQLILRDRQAQKEDAPIFRVSLGEFSKAHFSRLSFTAFLKPSLIRGFLVAIAAASLLIGGFIATGGVEKTISTLIGRPEITLGFIPFVSAFVAFCKLASLPSSPVSIQMTGEIGESFNFGAPENELPDIGKMLRANGFHNVATESDNRVILSR